MLELSLKTELADFELVVEQTISSTPLAIFGPSGAGKSTIIRSIAGIFRPDSGRIVLAGRLLFDSASGINLPPEKRSVGYVPQEGYLFPHLSVKKNLEYGFRRIVDRPVNIGFDDVVGVLELGLLLDRSVNNLSGGERQRISLGRALLTSPALLLFDEPLASVDEHLKRKILPYLKRAIEHFRIPAVYISHSHEEVTQIAKHIMVIRRGKVVGCGNYLEIIDNPEVYGTFSREGIDNALHAEFLRFDDVEGYTVVRAGEAEFKIPPLVAEPDSTINMNVKANDIILALTKPTGISTRNVMRGRVIRITQPGEKLHLAHIDVGCELLVELTPSAIRELGLKKGIELWVLIKTNSFSIV